MSYTFDSRAYSYAKRQKHAQLFWELQSSGDTASRSPDEAAPDAPKPDGAATHSAPRQASEYGGRTSTAVAPPADPSQPRLARPAAPTRRQ